MSAQDKVSNPVVHGECQESFSLGQSFRESKAVREPRTGGETPPELAGEDARATWAVGNVLKTPFQSFLLASGGHRVLFSP